MITINPFTLRERRAHAREAAVEAGNKAKQAKTMSLRKRRLAYEAQNKSTTLTPRQRRRIKHKNHIRF